MKKINIEDRISDLEKVLKEKCEHISNLDKKISCLEIKMEIMENSNGDKEESLKKTTNYKESDEIENIKHGNITTESDTLEDELSTTNIPQLDGISNKNSIEREINVSQTAYDPNVLYYRIQNEYERRDPITEAPYFFNDDELEDFAVECKICGKEFEGKSLYNTHVDISHPCKTCQQHNGGDIHHCPYRDFILP